MRTLTQAQTEFYQEHGYLHLRRVLPPDLIELGKSILGTWADWQIAQWVEQGLLDDALDQVDFNHRLAVAWEQAGRPRYVRSPRRDLVSPAMYRFLRHPALVDVVEDLLGTCEVWCHDVFNARPKLPDQLWTDTPWHQDAQYYQAARDGHVISVWVPMVPVSEANSCLQVAPDMHRGRLFEGAVDETGFLGLTREDRAKLQGVSIEMEPGDLLCFPQLTPHRALPNRSDGVRWSLDLRYQSATAPMPTGQARGFLARSADPARETPVDAWLAKWEDLASGSY